MKILNNLFCLIWKSNDISFNQAIKELKDNFKFVHNVLSDKLVTSFFKYEYKPKKVQPQLTNMIVYDIETFNTDRVVLYANCIYGFKKISGKYYRDITEKENNRKKIIGDVGASTSFLRLNSGVWVLLLIIVNEFL